MWYAESRMDTVKQKRVIHATGDGWEGVSVEGYRPGAAVGVERHTIVGSRKTDPAQAGPSKELRYFELQPGAVSRLEKHEHEHFVIVKRGEEPFGFYCFVDAARDFSQEPSEEEIERLMHSPAGKVAKPFAVPPPQKC